MIEEQIQQPVELSECPRSRWYEAEGRQLRAEGWNLRSHGDKWNGTHALIERRAASVDSDKASPAALSAGAKEALVWMAMSDEASNLTDEKRREIVAQRWGVVVSAELKALRSGSHIEKEKKP